ncbi:MAG: YraN family protein [Gammaproteobacteria bacterium]|nr:YraN family protein [Gammaproteobacteria bacterium]
MKTGERGAWAESIALHYLGARGLRLLTRNYRCLAGEIDIVMKDNDMLVFIEVRYRASTDYGSPLETINHTKQTRILKTASHYLLTHGMSTGHAPCRFDVVVVTGAKPCTEWIKAAFQA